MKTEESVEKINYFQCITTLTLAEALNRYCDSEMRKAYQGNYKTDKLKLVAQARNKSDFVLAGQALINLAAVVKDQNRIYSELKNQILNLIKSGDLIACRFELPRKLKD